MKKFIYKVVLEVEERAPSEAEARKLLNQDFEIWAEEADVGIKVKKCELIAEQNYKSPFED